MSSAAHPGQLALPQLQVQPREAQPERPSPGGEAEGEALYAQARHLDDGNGEASQDLLCDVQVFQLHACMQCGSTRNDPQHRSVTARVSLSLPPSLAIAPSPLRSPSTNLACFTAAAGTYGQQLPARCSLLAARTCTRADCARARRKQCVRTILSGVHDVSGLMAPPAAGMYAPQPTSGSRPAQYSCTSASTGV